MKCKLFLLATMVFLSFVTSYSQTNVGANVIGSNTPKATGISQEHLVSGQQIRFEKTLPAVDTPSCAECIASRSRCHSGCDNEPDLIKRAKCVNECNREYYCVIGNDCK